MFVAILLIWAVAVFVIALLYYGLKAIIAHFKPHDNIIDDCIAETETDDTSEINRLERIENYDKQIDGYTQLIKLLDKAYQAESDTKKQAAILSKQLATLEKLNKTIEKREKLG